MSSEPSSTPEPDHDDATPKAAKPSSKGPSATDILETIRREEKRMIGCILPQAQKNPELYQNIITKIKSSKISQPKRWREHGLVKYLTGWLAVAEEGERPDLERLIGVLAIFDCYASNAPSQLRTGLAKRGLRAWAIRKLKGGRASTERISSQTPRAPQKETNVKQETILPSIEIDQIAPRASSTTAQGLKRRAEDPPAENLPKRTVSQADHDALVAQVARLNEALDAHQRRTSYRNFGIQTSPPPTETSTNLPSSVTEQLVRHNRTLAEHSRILYDQDRAIADLPSVIREIVRQETHNAVHQEVQRAFVTMSNDTGIFPRSQGHVQSYTFLPNQSVSSYTLDSFNELQMVVPPAPQGRATGGRLNSRLLQPRGFDYGPGH
ncbi:hypothetical protein BHE90_002377 [Fusarium euwallaceae]|uniref:Uncharacterized protein n=2 Tax=Fusarium solani species complex TaxID=232080 RepID=A0A3M2SCQ7_9HYPO|nr:hypothetical protein CDV36_004987 [Fusarium kuroshium]RTE83126.1 hypothetical protein BHE90_002377 [Fusarium euwallaceae]